MNDLQPNEPDDHKGFVGAPTEYADAEEMPEWVSTIVKAASSGPILIGFFCGFLPGSCAAIACIASLFL